MMVSSDERNGFDDFDSGISIDDDSLLVSGTQSQTKTKQSKTGRFEIQR